MVDIFELRRTVFCRLRGLDERTHLGSSLGLMDLFSP